MSQFYTGVVEDRTTDPLKLGRCKVRIVGVHTEDKTQLPTSDLPWALLMQPTTSAAMSGVGFSPLGPVEGTLVVVVFTDQDLQQPIIIGTIGGIPQPTNPNEGIQHSTDGSVVSTGDASVVGSPEVEEKKINKPADTKKPFSLSLSTAGLKALKTHEGLASIDRNRRRIGSDSTPDSAEIFSYQDTSGIWTIGWGSTKMPDGSAVTSTSIITKKIADELLAKRLSEEFEPGVKRNIRVPVTQSMYDASVSMAYNMGVSGFLNTEVASSLNAGRYEEAASFIEGTKTNGGVLTSRRKAEANLFLRDGVPTPEGEIVATAKTEEQRKNEVDKTNNPVILPKNSAPVGPATNAVDSQGFVDPNKVYPKWLNEPDTHRLARNESIDKTVVFAKEAARIREVPTASGSTWSQPPIPYNALYPYNHVFATESGHLEEWDDTKGNERRHSYHKSGTFQEIDVNGTRVTRIVGDNYEILERNGNLLVKGSCNITVKGNSAIRIENDATIQVLGNTNLNVTGNLTTAVGGNFRVRAAGEFSVDAKRIDLNSGVGLGITIPTETSPGSPSMSTLTTPSRKSEANASYETPEEGDPSVAIAKDIEKGRVDPVDIAPATPAIEEKKTPEKPAAPVSTGCDEIHSMKEFTAGFKLTNNFTLGQVCRGSSGIPSGTNYGLSANTIVCNLKKLTENCLEQIKARYPNMRITNSWRSERVNVSVGGSKTSDHLTGSAADIQFDGFSRKQHFEAIIEIQKLIPAFKQLILEYKGSSTWIHVSFDSNNNKMQCLTMDAAKNTVLSSGSFLLIA